MKQVLVRGLDLVEDLVLGLFTVLAILLYHDDFL